MTDEGYEAAHEAVAWEQLNAGVLRVTGDDANDFLDRTVTADLGDRPTHALLLDPDGKTQDSLRVLPREDGYLVVSRRPEETAETWRSNVFVEDVTVEGIGVEVVSVQGPEAAEAAEELDATAAYEARRTPAGGYDVVGDVSPDAPSYDEHADALRVEGGIAGFENELKGRVPVGARLSVFSEDKCYVGQEVVARIRQRGGGPSRVLACFDEVPDSADAGDVVEYDGTAAGELTTIADSPRLGNVALGYVDADAVGGTVALADGEAHAYKPPLVADGVGA